MEAEVARPTSVTTGNTAETGHWRAAREMKSWDCAPAQAVAHGEATEFPPSRRLLYPMHLHIPTILGIGADMRRSMGRPAAAWK